MTRPGLLQRDRRDDFCESRHGAGGEAGKESEIKGPGPFRSKALMVLKKFRDLPAFLGPVIVSFLNDLNGLSGTFGRRGRHG